MSLGKRFPIALGALALALVTSGLIVTGTLGIGDPYGVDVESRYFPPSLGHPFGTDALGRDMLVRASHATALSMTIVFESILFSFFLALLLGGMAGYYYRTLTDSLVSWIISLLYAVPFLLIVVALAAVLKPGIGGIYLIIGAIGWAAPARIVRADVARIRSSGFVLALKSFGFSDAQILVGTVIPTAVFPAMQALILFVPELVGTEVALSFFGLGVQPPTPSLGRLIYQGLSESQAGWWLAVFPSFMLLLIMVVLLGLSRPVQSEHVSFEVVTKP